MALPLHPDPSRPGAWQRGVGLPQASEEAERPLPGFPGYFIDTAGTVWRAGYTDRCNRRHARAVTRRRWLSGTSQYRLWVNGFPKWISENKLLKLLK